MLVQLVDVIQREVEDNMIVRGVVKILAVKMNKQVINMAESS